MGMAAGLDKKNLPKHANCPLQTPSTQHFGIFLHQRQDSNDELEDKVDEVRFGPVVLARDFDLEVIELRDLLAADDRHSSSFPVAPQTEGKIV
jgi:hypothetical protein